ncbi:flagellar biosynthetic protein FliO [Roseibium sediminicola]|uniref:Flagellar biosynthetic protein FliO n=1 Tax=Roseibium sediminicola TaxID=2933272 RepID=A0ABT0GZI7_9HYPH|nr:flagellar biosynthetic protein FliO [Roseibium sp. CAU 1639]MCK7614859.1 flagellar biosynthetic protein FliO [Roseibium sp. CAU 1639]
MYNWIETTFNVSGGVTQAIAVILALAVVLVLFALFIFILKRLMGGQATQNRNRQPRIAVMDSASIDTRRRLVLIRRDNIEHLLLIGGPTDVVVEPNIIRNTPLTQQRPGQGHGLAGQVPLRGPVAPGPDIPPRPDDLVAQSEVPPPPAMQARPPAATSSHAPAAPISVQSPAPVSLPNTAASAEPAPQRPVSVPPKPTPSPAPVKSPAPVTETGGGLNRAADLLRAATQNGFNRGGSKPAVPGALSSETAPAEPEAAGQSAPEVRPVPKPADAAGSAADGKTGSALKSLTRPFSPRDRPSYGNHSITPPASGPAARAKTALLKPLEAARGQDKVEPVLTATASQITETAPPVAAPPALSAPDEDDAAAQAQTQASAPQDKPEIKHQSDVKEATSEKAPSEAAEAPAATGETATTAEPDIALDMSDLLEDVPAPAQPPQTELPKSAPPKSGEDNALEASTAATDQEQSQSGEAAKTAPDADHDKPAANLVATTVKPAPRPSGGLGDKNPIEEEMAKILDELGGQPN